MSQKLTAMQAGHIRAFHEYGFCKAVLAREYGVHRDTVRNVLRGTSFANGDKRPSRKLTDDQVREIRAEAIAGTGDQAIADKLGNIVTRSTVRQVIERKSYQEVA